MKFTMSLAVPAAAILSGIAVTAAPTANASDDDAFLQGLAQRGITWQSPQPVVQLGHDVCGDWALGEGFRQVFVDVKTQAPQLIDSDVAFFIGTATQAYCPQYVPYLPGALAPKER